MCDNCIWDKHDKRYKYVRPKTLLHHLFFMFFLPIQIGIYHNNFWKHLLSFAKKIFSRQNSLFQNSKEKFGGKKFTWQKRGFYFAKARGPKFLCEYICVNGTMVMRWKISSNSKIYSLSFKILLTLTIPGSGPGSGCLVQ